MSLTCNIDKTFHIRACRICLDSECSNMVKINEQSGWLQQFENCFGLIISSSDLTHNLCQQCAESLKKYSKFKELCYKSDKLWKSLTAVKCRAERIELYNLVKDQNLEDEKYYNINIESIHNDFNVSNDEVQSNDLNILDIKNENATIKNEAQIEIPTDKNITDTKDTVILLQDKDAHSTSSAQKNVKLYFSKNVVSNVKNIFKCKRCCRNYVSKVCYLKHLELCNTKIKKHTTTCQNQVYKSDPEIKSQNTSEISKSVSHFCGVCKFSTKDVDELTQHLDEHWTNNDLQCMMCELVGKDLAATAAHRYTHYANKASYFLCHICKKKTKSQLTLEFHYRKVHLNKIGGLCSQPQCDRVYNTWKSWKRHERTHCHPGYICDICGQKYKHKYLIAEHLMNHIKPSINVCDVCGKTFLRLRNMRSHIENVHVKSDPMKCSHCNRMFKNAYYLKKHQKQLTMEKIWKCEFCPMEYPKLCMLKSHLKSHSDERPHCCHICGSRYKAKSQLLIHMRNHTGDRPYKCVHCAKAFKSSQLLKVHVMIHTGILPHKCVHCEKMFRCKKRMMKHCALHHKALDKNN